MKKRTWLGAAVLSLALLAPSVQAHPLWMLPSEFNLSTEESFWITVDATAAHGVFTFDKPLGLDSVSIYKPNGDRQRMGPYFKGKRRSVFDLEIDTAGTYKIELSGQQRYVTTYEIGARNTSRRIFANKQEAEIPEGAKNVKTTAVQTLSAFYVTQGAPSNKVLEATGKGFELHPLTHPSDVVAKENARFKFTFDGEPLANLDIEITPHGTAWRNSREQMNLKTDKNGVVTFKPTVVGPHLLMTSMRKNVNSPLADAAGVNYHLTFEVLSQ